MLKLFIILFVIIKCDSIYVYGPGLRPDLIVMPARYFFVNISEDIKYVDQNLQNVKVEIHGKINLNANCRIWVNQLNLKNGLYLIRYKIFDVCYNLRINIFLNDEHVEKSPMIFSGPILEDNCDCPEEDFNTWLNNYGCPKSYKQINEDLKLFNKLNFNNYKNVIIKKYHNPESTSFCHYIVFNNKLHRKCYGKHVGFNMFSDNILLSLMRKVKLPDVEFFMNLGDWPLVKKESDVLPMFSWCGSDDTIDIVLPTYDLTESSLECMGRVTLDMLSVQGNVNPWSTRLPRAFWRGRDSRMERLKLVDIARANSELFNASLTNFFFFKEKEAQYGPKESHISFFKFFDYKYQINIDGTVAAYRLPYLLGGGGMVLKQSSPYYEHFYKQMESWVHYVPVARNLSDIVQMVEWARDNDEKAAQIASNAQKFANDNLLPQNIICYHAVLIHEWSKRLVNKVIVSDDMTAVPQKTSSCDCNKKQKSKDEL